VVVASNGQKGKTLLTPVKLVTVDGILLFIYVIVYCCHEASDQIRIFFNQIAFDPL
jgi:hypothetical protein